MKLKNNLINLHNKVLSLSTFKLIILMFFSLCIVQILISPLYKIYPTTEANVEHYDMSSLSLLIPLIIRTGIRTPIIETLIFQTFIIRAVWCWTRIFFEDKSFWANIIPIVISALIFGLAHLIALTSYVKLLNSFLVGLIFAYTYVVAYLSGKKATLCVICVHGLWNTFVILLNFVLS